MKQTKTAPKTAVAPKFAPPSPVSGVSLPVGAHPGNTGGKKGRSGRKPDALRRKLQNILASRTAIVGQIADGKVVQRTEVQVADLVPHLQCAKCEGPVSFRNVEDLAFLTVTGQISASPDTRLKALDLAAKYGIGTLKEVSVESVRERVRQTLDVIRQHLPEDQAEPLIERLRPVWA